MLKQILDFLTVPERSVSFRKDTTRDGLVCTLRHSGWASFNIFLDAQEIHDERSGAFPYLLEKASHEIEEVVEAAQARNRQILDEARRNNP